MTRRLDATDRTILEHLMRNARLPVARLAKTLGIARTTVQARIDRMEAEGAIDGYTVRLAPDLRREDIRATVLLQFTPSSLPQVLARLKALPSVAAAHTTSGRFDLCCDLRTGTTLELDELLDTIGEIEGVQAMESLIHLSTRIDRDV